jgi:hypothetical protein
LVIVRCQANVAPALVGAFGRALQAPQLLKAPPVPEQAAPTVARLVYSMLGMI